eukprot:CAMPEP_0201658358 /NCGR_PEP_ID=MMETSP0494-20130426/1263_1 /ASSEMBLY_ACC=CAM_ASM_000839 /TAXON_ID=420259 /ORGANISM="Thalassiosira gravida, Strain GMp14c1" /LENGTH=687 /DNA_ID=CAMNT_0048135331 /DNA_START=4 /DNA_END=2067 /DNA_ORIENTATION=-
MAIAGAMANTNPLTQYFERDDNGDNDDDPSPIVTSTMETNDQAMDSNNGVIPVSPNLLLLAAVPLLLIALAGHRYNLGLQNSLLIGIVRSFVQLMILGSILHPIFQWGVPLPWVVFVYVLFMILITTKESISRTKYTYHNHAILTFLSFLLTITSVSSFAFLFIIRPNPRWNPQYVIPICGMLMGNCITSVALTCNTLSTNIMEGGKREIELYLSFGATGWDSMTRLIKGCISTGATPIVNSMNVIGLVSIPGMMTGQILGGSDVTEAAHYQILITWLIATCTFVAILLNVVILYRVAFDSGCHVLRTDRFVPVAKKRKKKKGSSSSLGTSLMEGMRRCCDIRDHCERASTCCCCWLWGRHQQDGNDSEVPNDVETQPLSNQSAVEYGTDSILPNKVQIQTRQLTTDSNATTKPFFHISNLQFSVPEGNAKRLSISRSSSSSLQSASKSSSHGESRDAHQQQQQQQNPTRRVLCTNLNAHLHRGEVGIVSGPSGSGKSTLLRVLSGLTPMDDGDVVLDGSRLAGIDNDMVQWRTAVRYVTQYKVDIPGTPRELVLRVASFSKRDGPQHGDEMVLQTMSYLQQWGMGSGSFSDGENGISQFDGEAEEEHPHLDKEWKNLSGGESQRMILAIAMASRPSVLLLDEATSGLDTETEKCVEKSIMEYVKKYHAVVLWVTHSHDIAERLLKE